MGNIRVVFTNEYDTAISSKTVKINTRTTQQLDVPLQRTHLSILPFSCIFSSPLSRSAATATGLQSYHTEYVLYFNSPLQIGFSNCATNSIFKCVLNWVQMFILKGVKRQRLLFLENDGKSFLMM